MNAQHPRTLYASLWGTRRPPWAVYAPSNLPGGGLYKSTDGGDTWHQLSGGLPSDDYVGKIGIAIAPSNSNRLYAVVDDLGTAIARSLRGGGSDANAAKPSGGIYRSDDGGATWTLVNNEQRLWGRGWYFGQISVDPTNPDRAYDINTSTYMTLDAGKTWVPVKGAPGGDDYHQLWIDPRYGNRMALSSDQGTVVSVDGAKSWSTWYNQPTAEIYHVAASNGYPYRLYGAQQDSGAVSEATWSRMACSAFVIGSRFARPEKAARFCLIPRTQTCCTATAINVAIWQTMYRRPQAVAYRRLILKIRIAAPGLCRKSSQPPMRLFTTPTSSSSARATAGKPGRRSAPI